jgi:tetratricopeptide (TPR) repeat protein
MKRAFLCCIAFYVTVAYCQKCDSLYNAAFRQYGLQQYKNAAVLYEQAFKCNSANTEDYYNAGCVFSKSGNKDKSFEYLKLATDKGYKDLIWITTDSDLENLHQDKRWNSVIEKVKENMENYEKQFDQPLRKRIFQMVETDQKLRKNWGEIEKKYGKQSHQYDSLSIVIDSFRTKHSKELEVIYSERGFPTTKLIGEDAVYNIWVLALHSLDIQFQKLTLFYLTEEAKTNGIGWEQIAMLTDRISFNEKEPQLFGTRFDIVDMSKRQVRLYPVKDANNLDNRRKALNLKSVKEGYAEWDMN